MFFMCDIWQYFSNSTVAATGRIYKSVNLELDLLWEDRHGAMMYRRTDGQADIQRDRQRDRQTDRQTDRLTCRQTER